MCTNVIKHSTFDCEAGFMLLDFLGNTRLTVDMKKDIVGLIRERINYSVTNQSGNKGLHHYHLQHFYEQKEWDALGDPMSPEAELFRIICTRALRTDVFWVSEKTYVHWIAMLMLLRNPRAYLNPDTDLADILKDRLKVEFRALRRLRSQEGLLVEMPTSPQEFRRMSEQKFLQAYPNLDAEGNNGPVKSPLDEVSLEYLRTSL